MFRSGAACCGCGPAYADASPASRSWRGRLAHSQPPSRQGEACSRGRPAPSPACVWMELLLTSSWAEAEKHLCHRGTFLFQLWGSHTGLPITLVCSLASVQRNNDQVHWGEQPAQPHETLWESTGGQTTPSHPVCHLGRRSGFPPSTESRRSSFCAQCGSTPDISRMALHQIF